MADDTLDARRRLYLLSRVVVARHYRRRLTLAQVAGAVSSSPRQVQRAYAQVGDSTFREDLLARRLSVAAQLLIEQPAIPVRDVARLVGYRQAPYFARVFRERYGVPPARFREQARAHRAHEARVRASQPREPSRQSGPMTHGRELQALRRSPASSAGVGGTGGAAPGAAGTGGAVLGASGVGGAAPGASGAGPAPGALGAGAAASSSMRSARARCRRISVPPPGARSASTRPPCCSATCRTIAKPSPEPGRPRASAPR